MYNDLFVTAIIPAAGRGVRMADSRGRAKQFIELRGVPVIARTLTAFEKCDLVDAVVVVAGKDERGFYDVIGEKYGIKKLVCVAEGGETRQISVGNGVAVMPPQTGVIVIHDGARCLVGPECIEKVIKAAVEHGAAIAAERATDTVKTAGADGYIASTVDRNTVYLAKTPQVFLKEVYLKALENAPEGVTDDASLCEAAGIPVKLVEDEGNNIKLTVPGDVPVMEALIEYNEGKRENMRIGHGFDAHRLTAGRKLVLGGVEIPYEKGLLGHSDADVLIHAVIDALLGAAGLGDIGRHFPPTDDAYKDISSLILLGRTAEMLRARGFSVVNVDATVIAQAPRLAGYIDRMAENIAGTLGVDADRVNVKATTEEHMGYTGSGEGISAHAVCAVSE